MNFNQKIRLILANYKRLNLRLNKDEITFLHFNRNKSMNDKELKKFHAIYNSIIKQIEVNEHIYKEIKTKE